MAYYLICFLVSCLLFWFGQGIIKHHKIRFIVYLLALLVPATLAGVRDVTVGTDVAFYIAPVFEDAVTSPSPDQMERKWDGWIDYGYLVLSFIGSRLLPSFNTFLFLIAFLEAGLVLFALYKWKEKFPIWLGMFSYFTFFFNESLSTMRQCLAMSIVIFAAQYIFQKRYWRFLLLVVVAAFFHKSALLSVSYLIIYKYTIRFPSYKARALLVGSIVVFFIFLATIISTFLPELDTLTEVANRAAGYLNPSDEERVPYKIFLFFSFLFILFQRNRRQISALYGENTPFFEVMLALVILSQLLPLVGGAFIFRFSFTFTWWLIVLLPITFASLYRSRIPPFVVNSIFVMYCLFYWFFNFMIFKQGGTQNYSSRILSSIF